MNLYELADEFKALESMLYNDEGEITLDHEELLAHIERLITTKTDGYVQFVQKLEDEIEIASKRISEMTAFKNARKNAIERLKDYAHNSLTRLGKDKVTGNLGSISIRKPSKALEITNIDFIPEKYCRYPKTIDTELLKADLKFEEIIGARLVDGKRSISIKLKVVK